MRRGFSMIEILLALMFVSFSFLPIYNLFRFGQAGAKSNVKEVVATNYASDLVNFLRNMTHEDVKALVSSGDEVTFDDDSAIQGKFPNWNLKTEDGFKRSLVLRKFKGNKEGLAGLSGWWDNFINNRRSVPCYLAEVTVTFRKPAGGDDEILLCTIIMD